MTVSSDDGALVAAVNPFKRPIVLLSPIVVVGLGFVLARIADSIWAAWSWIPIIIYYWGVLVALIAWGGDRRTILQWLQPSRQSRWIWVWRVLSLAVPSLFLPTAFLSSLASMNGWWVVVSWFSLGAINAWIEEGYWRGLVMDAASRWPGWLAASYSALCFGASHPLIFGFQGDDPMMGIAGFLGVLIAGLIWGLVYRQTRSLRLPILGHFLQQMLAPPYNVFIQLAAILR
jgi:membrane protease YdiL (CAAX protease family)